MEKRIYPRFNLDCPVKIEEDKLVDYTFNNISVKTIDISEGGIGLYLNNPLPTYSSVRVELDLFPSEPPARISGSIKWITLDTDKDMFRCGIEFSNLHSDIIDKLRGKTVIDTLEEFLECPLPFHISKTYSRLNIVEKLTQQEIMELIDFTPPFLKVEKFILGNTIGREECQSQGLGTGIITTDDTKGHYNDTIFLALCGWIMASAASVHLAVLVPKSAPQVVEANGVRPLISMDDRKSVWKPAPEGTRFFVETLILKKKLKLAIVNTVITFSNIIYGTIDELKLIITNRENIFNVMTFPSWRVYDK